MTRIAVLTASREGRVDAIMESAIRLVASLPDAEIVVHDTSGGWRHERRRWRTLSGLAASYDTLILEYNPFLYGRRGFAPWLVREAATLRLRRQRARLVLHVHETAMPLVGVRKTLMGIWQRAQLFALRACADTVVAVIEGWANKLRAAHIPIGSTLPDMRHEREAARDALGARDRLVVATLSSGHESHLVAYVELAVRRIATQAPDVMVLQLGAGAQSLQVAGVETVRPGFLPDTELARMLAASDLFLAPLIDGVSTRRTSMMAALQHEVAVVGTDGHLTDSVLRGPALELAPVGDPESFSLTAAALAAAPARRSEIAQAGRRLYETMFDWAVVARRFVEIIQQ